jgi:hypothetical protein
MKDRGEVFNPSAVLTTNGTPPGTRTPDPLIKSSVLGPVLPLPMISPRVTMFVLAVTYHITPYAKCQEIAPIVTTS